jgi:Na+-transporting methylmalonyl-CoA/oxaloacetate decarboxylase beta subunit
MAQNRPSTSSSKVTAGISGIVLIIAVSYLIPVAAPFIGLILMIAGFIFHKNSVDPLVKNLAKIYAITGLLLDIISILFFLFFYAVR